jgi:5-methyltetrahydrofolate--homocysteine methyltransferase
MRTTLGELLSRPGPILADGAMGTLLLQAGLQPAEAPEAWSADRPSEIASIHRSYIQAGAQIVLTNTFGANRFRLAARRQEFRLSELNRTAAGLAGQEALAAEQAVLVAGSIGPTGKMMKPYGDLEGARAADAFAEQAAALAEGGVDVFWIETASDLQEVAAAIAGCRRAAAQIPIVATLTFDTHGRTMMGTTPRQAMEALAPQDLAAVGANCGNGPDEIEALITEMHRLAPEATLVAKSNAGKPRLDHTGQAVYDASPERMATHALAALAAGARIIGGCCGSTPEHIAAMRSAIVQAM